MLSSLVWQLDYCLTMLALTETRRFDIFNSVDQKLCLGFDRCFYSNILLVFLTSLPKITGHHSPQGVKGKDKSYKLYRNKSEESVEYAKDGIQNKKKITKGIDSVPSTEKGSYSVL